MFLAIVAAASNWRSFRARIWRQADESCEVLVADLRELKLQADSLDRLKEGECLRLRVSGSKLQLERYEATVRFELH